MKRVPLVCRVCGMNFTAPRFDAKTCSSTCRSRLRRGGDLAYLNDPDLPGGRKRAARAMHAAYDEEKAAHRELVAEIRARREERRRLKQQKVEQERQRFIDEITGRAQRELQQRQEAQRRRQQLGGVAGCITLFAKERRNDFSAEAIAALKAVRRPPVRFPEGVATSLPKTDIAFIRSRCRRGRPAMAVARSQGSLRSSD
jgi:hypothetical protein